MKIPPQNLEAETSILAACLLFDDMAKEAITLLKPNAFYRTLHQKIFESITEETVKGNTIDITIIRNSLKNIENIGVELAKILEEPIPPSMHHYAKIINDAATARETISICQRTVEKVFDNEQPISETINDLQNQTLSLGAESKESFITMRELTGQSVDRYEALKNQKATPGIKTGYFILDNLTGGLKGSKLIIIAARPAIGKTAFMCNLVENMARRRTRCGVFELEMDKEALDDRWFASMADINSIRLSTPPATKDNEITGDEWERLNAAGEKKYEWPVLIDDQGNLTTSELKRRARKMKQMGVEIIFIDQLSEIRGDKKKSLFESNTEIVEELGRLKKELRIPIVLLAQLNRKLEERPIEDREPRLSDLKNTGMLEEKADIVLLGYRKHVYTELEADENHAQWHLAKHRGGPIKKIQMLWRPKQARFENIERNRESWME